MLLLRWLWIGNGQDGEIPPVAVFWTLRVLMFFTSFVLEDWALHELIHSRKNRMVAVMLVASSYVTWTYQTHTFSNSIETLVVLWSLVLIQRIVDVKVSAQRDPSLSSGLFAFWAIATNTVRNSNNHLSSPLLSLESSLCLAFSTASRFRLFS